MAKTATKTVKTQKEIEAAKKNPFNFILSPLGWSYDIVKYIFYSIVIGVFIEWTGMLTGYFDMNHAEQVLRTEFAYLGDNFSTTLFGVSAKDAALVVIKYLNSYVSVQPATGGQMISQQSFALFSNDVAPYFNAAIYIVMTIAIRCIVIALSIALFVLVAIAATVDGLHERELRKVGGGDEHGDVYHWAKSWVPKIIVLSPIIYLAWPGAINPNFILLPGMMLFFISVYLMFSKYKKIL